MEKRTVTQWCGHLGWNTTELMRQANISLDTARKATAALPLSQRVQRLICQAISQAAGFRVQPGDIQWDLPGIDEEN